VIDVGNANIRMHTYFNYNVDVNFHGANALQWDFIGQPLVNSAQNRAFYIPMIGDPTVSATMFAGLQGVFRTQDSGGSQAFLDGNCNEYTVIVVSCGDWVQIGANLAAAGTFVSQLARAPSDNSTMWAATSSGRLFVSHNANAAAGSVAFTQIDTLAANAPHRYVSGIYVDPTNPNHAWVSYAGFNAYSAPAGHVFDVTTNAGLTTATFNDLSFNLGDQPVTAIAADTNGDLYAGTDFGVVTLPHGQPASSATWHLAGTSLPPVEIYGLTIVPASTARVLYAATHGRGVWSMSLPPTGGPQGGR
jgi:hypothetical protein